MGALIVLLLILLFLIFFCCIKCCIKDYINCNKRQRSQHNETNRCGTNEQNGNIPLIKSQLKQKTKHTILGPSNVSNPYVIITVNKKDIENEERGTVLGYSTSYKITNAQDNQSENENKQNELMQPD